MYKNTKKLKKKYSTKKRKTKKRSSKVKCQKKIRTRRGGAANNNGNETICAFCKENLLYRLLPVDKIDIDGHNKWKTSLTTRNYSISRNHSIFVGGFITRVGVRTPLRKLKDTFLQLGVGSRRSDAPRSGTLRDIMSLTYTTDELEILSNLVTNNETRSKTKQEKRVNIKEVKNVLAWFLGQTWLMLKDDNDRIEEYFRAVNEEGRKMLIPEWIDPKTKSEYNQCKIWISTKYNKINDTFQEKGGLVLRSNELDIRKRYNRLTLLKCPCKYIFHTKCLDDQYQIQRKSRMTDIRTDAAVLFVIDSQEEQNYIEVEKEKFKKDFKKNHKCPLCNLPSLLNKGYVDIDTKKLDEALIDIKKSSTPDKSLYYNLWNIGNFTPGQFNVTYPADFNFKYNKNEEVVVLKVLQGKYQGREIYWPGTIKDFDITDNTYTIYYTDKDEQKNVNADDINLAKKLNNKDTVYVFVDRKKLWYHGTIIKCNEDNTYGISFEDKSINTAENIQFDRMSIARYED